MFDLLRAAGQWLGQFIIRVPLYVAAPSMIVIGALDSSLLSLPEINDYLVVTRCSTDHTAVIFFPLFAAAGSVIGCLLLYSLMKRGGQAVLRSRFRKEHIERVERTYSHFGFLALAVPALLPPPMPFKIFVATAGALEFPRWRFMVTIMIARAFRYYVEGVLAVFYGESVLRFIGHNGMFIMSLAAAFFIVGVIFFVMTHRRKGRYPPEGDRFDPEDRDAAGFCTGDEQRSGTPRPESNRPLAEES
jgi:membrane protein YqaA with SNARE-associated domain